MAKKQTAKDIRPFVSLLLVLATLFAVVFCKMEARRIGYLVWRDSRQYRSLMDQKHLRQIKYAKITQPERVRQLAQSQLTLRDAGQGQIIQMTGQKIAMRQ